MATSGRWQQIKTRILQRRIPHTVMSWRFLLPGQSRAVCLHRRVFLGAWPSLPRWQWVLIAFYSVATWGLFFSWQQIYFCMKTKSRETKKKFLISAWKQLLDLLVLALLHGIPPRFYYQFRLYQKSGKQWLDYIYDHELPHWHQVLLVSETSQKTLHLLTEKKAFAEQMANQGIASVQTCDFFVSGCRVEAGSIFQERSFYLKPNVGSRAEGNFVLSFDKETRKYRLFSDEIIETQNDILAEINRQVQRRDYLLQPLLQNHQKISALCGTSTLVTLRLVTVLIRGEPVALCAKLEIGCSGTQKGCWVLGLNLLTGKLSGYHDFKQEEFQRIKQLSDGKTLPFWQDAKDICLKAHRLFLDLPTIGWDVVFTLSGVKLLEGNVNWGVAGHQVLSDEPILNTRLAKAYL